VVGGVEGRGVPGRRGGAGAGGAAVGGKKAKKGVPANGRRKPEPMVGFAVLSPPYALSGATPAQPAGVAENPQNGGKSHVRPILLPRNGHGRRKPSLQGAGK